MSFDFGSVGCAVVAGGELFSAVDVAAGGGALVIVGLVLEPPLLPPTGVPLPLTAPVGLAPELLPPPAVLGGVDSNGPRVHTDRLTFEPPQEIDEPKVLHPLNTVVVMVGVAVGAGSRLLAMALIAMVKLSTG
jgi:hypothetical protein